MSKHQPKYSSCYYLEEFIDPRKAKYIINQSVLHLRKLHLDFDAIACRGISGLLIAPQIAARLGKSLLVVRKPAEDCHSSNMVEGDRATLRYIIVDDVIASGKTVQEIHKEIDKFAPQAKCIGVLQAYYFAKQDYSRDIFHTDITKRMEKKKAEEIASAVLKAVNVSKNEPKLLPPATLRTMLEIEWQARQFAKTQTVSPAPQKSKLYTSYPTIYNAGYEEIKWQTADGTPICKDANSWYKV